MSKITKLLVFGATGTQGHPVVDAGLRSRAGGFRGHP